VKYLRNSVLGKKIMSKQKITLELLMQGEGYKGRRKKRQLKNLEIFFLFISVNSAYNYDIAK
jgi:hypothetical protein